MAYNPVTDFMGIVRRDGGAEMARAPMLDMVAFAMSRMGIFELVVSQATPASENARVVWLRPANPSYSAEGTILLWNGSAWAPADFEAWSQFLSSVAYTFDDLSPMTTLGDMIVQSATGGTRLPVGAERSVLAVKAGVPAWDAGTWQSYAPVVTAPGTASFATTGRYRRDGDTVHFTLTVTVVLGSPAGYASVTLPIASKNACTFAGRNTGADGKSWTATAAPGGPTVSLQDYSNNFAAAAPSILTFSGSYEALA